MFQKRLCLVLAQFCTLSSGGLGSSMPMPEMLFCRNRGHYFSFLPTGFLEVDAVNLLKYLQLKYYEYFLVYETFTAKYFEAERLKIPISIPKHMISY